MIEWREFCAFAYAGIEMKNNVYEAIDGADAVVIVTEGDAFRALDLQRVKELAKATILAALRNIHEQLRCGRRALPISA